MKNISFDNPYLLLIGIPLLAVIIIPFAIAIRKDNKSKSVITSLVIHILIAALVSFGIAGTVITRVMTETDVIVVADVSYSANRNLDTLDSYIKNVRDAMPDNSKMGIVCFGKDYTLLTPIGGEAVSVKNAEVDDSATNIADALDYAATLFDDEVIKRIVLITDGKQTDSNATSRLINSIENLYAEGIYIDAIYLDDNIDENTHEVQLSGVEYTKSTYLNHDTVADILVQSNRETNAILSVYRRSGDDNEYSKLNDIAVTLSKGYNIINADLPASESGDFDYKIIINSENDTSEHNNEYLFTQSVSSEMNVLLIASCQEEIDTANALYGENAKIDAHIINEKTKDRDKHIPYKLEDICRYDEIMLSNVDVRNFNNFSSFLDSVEKAVSLFGKSLVTFGDAKIQNKTDDTLKALEDMLPVKYGNGDQDTKFVGIVIDASRSMETLDHFIMAKQAAIQIINLLNEGDYVTVVSFSGEVFVPQHPIQASKKQEIINIIGNIEPRQGTFIGSGLQKASELMTNEAFSSIENKQIFLISDGMSYTGEPDNPATAAKQMLDNGIITSTIHTRKSNKDQDQGTGTMKKIASSGGGEYYDASSVEALGELILSKIADNITESVVERESKVNIAMKNDSVLSGIVSLPDIGGYVYARSKASANTVLVSKYQKSAETTTDVPIYAYWDYGNGRVSALTTTLGGEWTAAWQDGTGKQFMQNILTSNTPKEKIDYPFTLNVEYDGTYSTVEIIPTVIKPSATVTVDITLPDGEVLTENLIFDSERYFYSFETPMLGRHEINVTYSYDGDSFNAKSFVNLSYSPEYDSFAVFDASKLHESVRNRGTVSEDGSIKLENDIKEVATYTISFTVPFLIAAIVLYIIDIIVRKIKWNDIKTLFRRKPKKGGA